MMTEVIQIQSPRSFEILHHARELIADPARWTQEVYARDLAGDECRPNNQKAESWCAIGALRHVVPPHLDYRSRVRATEKVEGLLVVAAGMALANYNDTHSHADVLALFDKAITSLIEEHHD